MLIKYRNLARNTASILWFNTIPAVALFAGFSIAGGASLLAWGGVLLTTVPMLVWVGYVMATQGVARTSERLPLINAQGALGVGLAAYAMKLGQAGGLPLALAVGMYLGFLWYSYAYAGFLNARPSNRLTVGKAVPKFSASRFDGSRIDSATLFQRPCVVVFYRGNWCPFCVAQVKELAARYQDIADKGLDLVFISPQPQKKSLALSKRFGIQAKFLVDEGNAAARALGLASEFGIPTGFQALGYDSETVMPTVLIVDAGGRLVWADQTNNYRVRPMPEVFLDVIAREGLARTAAA